MATPKKKPAAKKSAKKPVKKAVKKPAKSTAAAKKAREREIAARKKAEAQRKKELAAKKAAEKKLKAERAAAKKAKQKELAAKKAAAKKAAADREREKKRLAAEKAKALKAKEEERAKLRKQKEEERAAAKAAKEKAAPEAKAAKEKAAEEARAAKEAARRAAAKLPPPKPPIVKGPSQDGITSTREFDLKFLFGQRDLLQAERAKLVGQANRLEREANALIEDAEMGDVQFDDEGGEGDTMVVEREQDLTLSASARQTVEDIDAALARMKAGEYGYSEISGLPIPRERLKAIPWATELVTERAGGFGNNRR